MSAAAPTSGVLARALALVEADVRSGRRSLGAGVLGRSASGALHAALGVGAVVVAVAIAATVGVWQSSGAVHAAAGVVDLGFATLLGASVLAPVLGTASARVHALARDSVAPLESNVVLLASVLREAVSAPLGPALCIALGAAVGRGVAIGVGATLHAVVMTLLLAGFGVAIGGWLSLWTRRRARAGGARVLVAMVVSLLIASLVGGGAAASTADPAAWFAAAHAGGTRASLAPSGWAADALLPESGGVAWWAPLALAGLAIWALLASRHRAAPQRSRTRATAAHLESRWWARLDGPFGALVAKDLVLLRREPAVRAAVLRHAVPVAVPVATLMLLAYSASRDPGLSRRVAGWLPALGLFAHLATVGLTGAVAALPALDAGGRDQLAVLPVTARRVLFAKALAWTAVAAPTLATLTAALVLGVGAAVGEVSVASAAVAALEAASSVAAGAGAGLLAAALLGSTADDHRGQPASGGALRGGLIGGVVAAALTLAAVAPVAAAFHGVGGELGALGGTLVGPAIGVLATLAAATVRWTPGVSSAPR